MRGLSSEVGEVVAQLSGEQLDRAERSRLLVRLSRLLATGARTAGVGAAFTGRWLAGVVAEVAPHLPVRTVDELSAHHGGLLGDALADSLVTTASRATASVGAAGGTLVALEAAAPPALVVVAPLQLAAETLAVVAIELKLVAELHVVYGRAPIGTRSQVATAYLSAWVRKRGLDLSAGPPSLASVLGVAARRQLQARVVRRFGRNLSTLAPFLAGAVAGAELNRRETRSLGEKVLRDLR
ncbi:MAG TPA: hypothetical protein VNA30_00280 [Mycobacteriales bacterium]|nr:hypothetical protein [Mycobacteriales bacterium]